MVKVPFDKRDRPPVIHPEAIPPEPIDIPVVKGPVEAQAKKILCSLIDWAIEQLLKLKARLRRPLKAADMPEIEEE